MPPEDGQDGYYTQDENGDPVAQGDFGGMSQLEQAMQVEQAKGPDSDVPEQSMAAVSLLKDLKSGVDPTREAYEQKISGQLNDITQKKAELFAKLKSGGELSTSQAVGLGVLALGLMAAGGLMKGKRGLAMGANAFGLGGQLFLKQSEEEKKTNDALTKTQLTGLNSQENMLARAGLDSQLAPIKAKEATDNKLDFLRKAEGQGLMKPPGGNTTTIVMPKQTDQKTTAMLDSAPAAVESLQLLADKLKQLPYDDSLGSRAKFQFMKEWTATEEGKLWTQATRQSLQAAKDVSGGRPSQYLEQIENKLNKGDWSASPKDIAQLFDQYAGEVAARAAKIGRTAIQNRQEGGLEKTASELENISRSIGKNYGDPNMFLKAPLPPPGSSSGSTSVDITKAPPGLSPEEFQQWRNQQLMGGQ